MSTVDNILEHFGTKGMKWGVRKSRSGVVTGRRTKPEPSADKAAATAARSKIGKRGNTDQLSNEELQRVIGRMNLEHQLKKQLQLEYDKSAKGMVMKLLKNTAKSEFDTFKTSGQSQLVSATVNARANIADVQTGKQLGRHRKRK